MSDILDDDVVDGTTVEDVLNEIPPSDNQVIEGQGDLVSTVFERTKELILDQLSIRAEEGVAFAGALSESMKSADEVELYLTKDSMEVIVISDEGTVNWDIGC